MLKVNKITVEYSGMKAVIGASIIVGKGEFISIIGPNGAGKSSLLKAISGTASCTEGEIEFIDADITRMPAHKRTALGLIHIPEGRRIFPSLSVLENLELGAYRSEARAHVAENLKAVLDFFPILRARKRQLGCNLSGGEQQMLAVGRGLMAMPRLLMLDEPSLGLSPIMTDFIFNAIRDIMGKQKFSILLVEQKAEEALELCDRGYILETGIITMSNERDELLGNPLVQQAYLGTA